MKQRIRIKRDQRQKQIRQRKNFFPSLITTILLWFFIFSLVYFTDPFLPGMVPIFFIVVFVALLFTFALVFINTRRGFLVSVSLTIYLILRFFGIGNILNFMLLLGLAGAVELYYYKSLS